MRDIILRQKQEIERILKSGTVEREMSEKFGKYAEQDIIKAIIGVRRCGKSVFCLMGLKNAKFAYVNFDEKALTELENYDEVLKYVHEIYGEGFRYLLLDEIQNLDKWELWLNSLKRRGYNLIVTGSNAKLLSRELATHLTGRHISLELFPFSFREFLSSRGHDAIKNEYTEEEKGKLLNQLRTYIEIGGFPEVVVKGFDYSYLQGLFDSIIFKDIVKRYRIRYATELYDLAKYLLSNFSKEASFTKLKNVLGFGSVHTVQNYVGYLEEACLVFSIDRFSFKQKEQINAPKKIYAMDSGMINAAAFKATAADNLGRLMENVVAVELLRRNSYGPSIRELFYWKDYAGREVDFVLRETHETKQLVQVCYDISAPETKERELKALANAADELKCDNLRVITWDYEGEEKIHGGGGRGETVVYLPLWKWLLLLPSSSSLRDAQG